MGMGTMGMGMGMERVFVGDGDGDAPLGQEVSALGVCQARGLDVLAAMVLAQHLARPDLHASQPSCDT
jgi:hypothetical protein